MQLDDNDCPALKSLLNGQRAGQYERVAYYVDRFLFPDPVVGRRLLDIGGGDGSLALYLRLAREARVDVLDSYVGDGGPTDNYDTLLTRIDTLQLHDVGVIRCDVRDVQRAVHDYDAIYMRNCLHHIFGRDPLQDAAIVDLFSRLRRWLVKDGSLRIGETGRLTVWRTVPPCRELLFPGVDYRSKSGVRRWRRCARLAGFISGGVRWYVPYRLRHLRPLIGNELASILLRPEYILHMRKTRSASR